MAIQSQIFSALDGLNRIVDLLDEEETVRNEAILFCTQLAQTSAGSARWMIFSGGFEKLLNIVLHEFQSDGSYIVVSDCLQFCMELVQQDGMGAEVFLGSRSLVDCLAGFLDLRRGHSFLHPSSTNHNNSNNNEEEDNKRRRRMKRRMRKKEE